MKLSRYNHFDPETRTINAGQVYKTPYVYKSTVDADYTNISSAVNFDIYGRFTDATANQIKAEIDIFYAGYTWGTTSELDAIYSRWFSCTKTERDSIHSQAEQEVNAATLNDALDSFQKNLIRKDKIQNIADSQELIINEISTNVVNKDFRSINYITELDSGKKLTPERTFLKDGLVDEVIFYDGYVDESNKGTEVLKVNHSWTLEDDAAEPNKAAKKVVERTKTRKWKNKGGSYSPKEKVTVKKYNSPRQKGAEGRRRRQNILDTAQIGVVTILLVTGTESIQSEAELRLIEAIDTHEKAMNVYSRSGKGSIYADLLADSINPFFDTVIGATAKAALGLSSGWETNTVRDYLIEKLKAEI